MDSSRSGGRSGALAAIILSCLLVGQPAFAQVNKPAMGLDMQVARQKMMDAKGKKAYYTRTFDLSGLASYQPRTKINGVIRIWGSNYLTDGNLGEYWALAFKKFQPDAQIEYHLKSTIAAVPSLVFGVADLGVGRKITFSEQLLYERYKSHDPLEVTVATGSYDVTGWQPAYGIVVRKDNPLNAISMQQLDGVFGAERTGGWDGTSWHPEYARGPELNIRTWGQLGLTGEWANMPITPYGLNQRYHQAAEISDRLLKGSDKWNEKMRIYANYVSKDGALSRSLNDDLEQDKSGIAYIAAPTLIPPTLKILKLSWKTGGPYIPYTMDTVHDHSYPLYDEIYMYVDQKKGGGIDPKVEEFLRFVVSREGQAEVMRDGKYLPLTAAIATEQNKKLP